MSITTLEKRLKNLELAAAAKELPYGLTLMRLGKPPGRDNEPIAQFHTRESAREAGRYNIQQLEKRKVEMEEGQDILRWHIEIVTPRALNEAFLPMDTNLHHRTTSAAADKKRNNPRSVL